MTTRTTRLVRLLDPRGRLSQRGYCRLLIRLLLAFVATVALAVLAGAQGFRAVSLAVTGIGVTLNLAVYAAATIRRLHDRGRSAWWMLPYAAVTLAGIVPIEDFAETHPVSVIGATLALTGFSLWFLVETLFRRGTPGPNPYGPPPEL